MSKIQDGHKLKIIKNIGKKTNPDYNNKYKL